MVISARDLGIQLVHVLGQEGWPQRHQLVEHASCAPDVAFLIVWLVLPDLGRTVVWRPCLSLEKSVFLDLGDVQVAQLKSAVLCDEDVGAFNVSMHNTLLMELVDANHHLYKVLPDLLLDHPLLPALAIFNFAEQVSTFTQLGHQAQAGCFRIDEGLLERDNVWRTIMRVSGE